MRFKLRFQQLRRWIFGGVLSVFAETFKTRWPQRWSRDVVSVSEIPGCAPG